MEIRHCIVALFFLVSSAFPVQAEWFQEGQDKMGTRVFVKFWYEDARIARSLLAGSMAEFDRIDAAMSTFRADSEITRVNSQAAGSWVSISEELFGLIKRAVSLSKRTGGAFDITYDSIGQFYNFRERRRPTHAQVEKRLPAIGYEHLQLDEKSLAIRFSSPGVRINLGGIAKGYAVESVIQMLKRKGVRHALANAGGDTRVLGDRRGSPWIVGVRDPDDEMKFVARIGLSDAAISTSGDYEQYFMDDGVRYHHILDPATGASVAEVRGVSIIGPDATMTDGLSTSVFVMGADSGMQLIESLADYEGIVIDKTRRAHFSTGVNPL